ncbi:MAG: ThiF family adenylyltransferase [Balneola sp.]
MTSKDREQIYEHLYPGDNLEATCLALCGRAGTSEHEILLVREVIPIPYDKCERAENYVTWSTDVLEPLMDVLDLTDQALIKFHSHPSGFDKFSKLDDQSDRDVFGSIFSYTGKLRPHGSMVMLPDKSFLSRLISYNLEFIEPLSVTVIGDDIEILLQAQVSNFDSEINLRNEQTLGDVTMGLLSNLTIGVVGCSGTGSIVIELLNRLNVGKLFLVDPDKIEHKNLNRIINSRLVDAENSSYKVHVIAKAILQNGFTNDVKVFSENIESIDVLKALTKCDIIFGCVDTALGRHFINLLGTYYLIPIFDIGVGIDQIPETTSINTIDCAVNYVQPGESLMKRKVFSADELANEELKITNPGMYENQVREGYIKNVDSPAVISINSSISSIAINEFLSRIHSLKPFSNSKYNKLNLSLTEFELDQYHEPGFTKRFQSWVGLGDQDKMLGIL